MKNKIKKILMIFVILCFVIVNIQVPVRAATAAKHFLNNITYKVLKNGITAYGPGFTLNMDGDVVFCVDPMTEVNEGEGYSSADFSHTLRKEMSVIAYEGYYKHRNSADVDYWKFATNLMIWEKMGWTIKEVNGFNYNSYKMQVENAIREHDERPSFHNSNITINVGESITLTDTKNLLQEFTFKSSGGLLVSSNQNQLTIYATNESNESEKVLFHKIPDNCTGTSIIYQKRNSQDMVKFFVEDPVPAVVNVTVQKRGHVEIAKQDEDGTYVPNTTFQLSYNRDMTNPIGTYTTGENGKVLVENLLAQNVYIQETAVPSHLILDTTIHSVEIKPNTTVTYNANNYWKQGKVRIVKKDKKSGKVVKVEGAKYDIYKEDGTKVSTITSDKEGYATSDLLRYGKYYYVERLAPDKYQINTTQHPFVIDKDHTEQEFVNSEIYDDRVTAKTTITKVFKEHDHVGNGDAKIDGAVYGLYAWNHIVDPADGMVVYPMYTLISTHTIKDGKATAEVDYLGEYYWKEINDQASEGCMVDTEMHRVSLNYQGQNVPIVVENTISKEPIKTQAFQIQKLEDPNQNGESMPLGNAEFTVKLKSDIDRVGWDRANVYDKLITDEQGSATSKPLPYGEYIVRETKTPSEQYDPVADFKIQITENSTTPQTYRYFIDTAFKTKLAVYKKDKETDKIIPLSGMKFKIKALSKTADYDAGEYVSYWQWFPIPQRVDTWETTEEGFVFLEEKLRAGSYQIEEVESPYGYLLNQEPLKFTVERGWHEQMGPDNDTIVTTISFKDQPAKGQVKLDKLAEIMQGYSETESAYGTLFTPIYKEGRLSDVTFEIKAKTDIIGADGTVWYRAGQQVATMTSDGEHVTKSPLLPLGSEGHNLYTLQEIETKDGYVLDNTVRTFYFAYVNQNTPIVGATYIDEIGNELPYDDVLDVENEKQTALILATKHMEESIFEISGNPYQDVVFGVFAKDVTGLEEGSLVGISDVNIAGEFHFQLSQDGVYYVKEISTSPNYQLDETPYPFVFDYEGDLIQTIHLNQKETIDNKIKRGALEIYKLDDETKLPLKNVFFELAIDKDFKHIIQTKSTDETGKATFEQMEIHHTYYVRERYDGSDDMIHNGYVYDPTIHEIQMHDVEIIKLNLTNRQVKGKVQFTKTGESFQKVEIVEGAYGMEYHPVWSKNKLLGAVLTVEADEDITTYDGVEHYKKGDKVVEIPSDWDMNDALTLPVGKYKAYESVTPDGYIRDDTIYTFEIVANGKEEIQLQPISIYNERKKAKMKFHKTLEEQVIFKNEHAYEDVVFGIYAREDISNYVKETVIKKGSLIAVSHIDAKGQWIQTIDLPVGSYYMKELKTNAQYVLDAKEYDFTISLPNADEEIIVNINEGKPIVNELAKGRIELFKYTKDQVYLSYQERINCKDPQFDSDRFDKAPDQEKHGLPGVVFELAADKEFTQIIQTKITNANGHASFEDLELGTYYIREQKSLDFYECGDEIFEVIIKTNGQIESIEVENVLKKYDIEIKKVDADQMDVVLENAVFAMYRDVHCTQEIAQAKSDAQGIARFKDIPYGMHVYIKEIQAPSNYQLSEEMMDVMINEEWVNQTADTRRIVFENKKIPPVETGDTTHVYIYWSFLFIGFFMMMINRKVWNDPFDHVKNRKRGLYGRVSKNSRRNL